METYIIIKYALIFYQGVLFYAVLFQILILVLIGRVSIPPFSFVELPKRLKPDPLQELVTAQPSVDPETVFTNGLFELKFIV